MDLSQRHKPRPRTLKFTRAGEFSLLTSRKYSEQQIAKLRDTKIDDAEIARVTKDFPEGAWKQSATEALNQFKSLTWEQAINKHDLQ